MPDRNDAEPPAKRERLIWIEPWHRIQPDELITRPRAMTDEQLLDQRVEWLPKAPCCRSCRHLGEPVNITDRRQARRVRRRCPHHPLGYTDSDWTACEAFEEKGGGQWAVGSGQWAVPAKSKTFGCLCRTCLLSAVYRLLATGFARHLRCSRSLTAQAL